MNQSKNTCHLTYSIAAEFLMMSIQNGKLFPQPRTRFCEDRVILPGIHHDHDGQVSACAVQCGIIVGFCIYHNLSYPPSDREASLSGPNTAQR